MQIPKAAARLTARPSFALPWFSLAGSPMGFDLIWSITQARFLFEFFFPPILSVWAVVASFQPPSRSDWASHQLRAMFVRLAASLFVFFSSCLVLSCLHSSSSRLARARLTGQSGGPALMDQANKQEPPAAAGGEISVNLVLNRPCCRRRPRGARQTPSTVAQLVMGLRGEATGARGNLGNSRAGPRGGAPVRGTK